MTTIKLESNDKQIREISREIAFMSGTIKELVELMEMTSSYDSSPIPLLNVNSSVLDKVIVWLKYHSIGHKQTSNQFHDQSHQNNEDNEDNQFDGITQFDKAFFSCERETLFELLLAANYLNIKDMQTIGCKFAAKDIAGKNCEEVRKLWNITSDYTPEEEEKLRIENKWADIEPKQSK